MKRFSILEEMERLALGQSQQQPQPKLQSKQFTLNQFFSTHPQPQPQPHPQPQPQPQPQPHPQPQPTCQEHLQTTTQSTSIYHIFTDGSCVNNGRKGAKAAYACVFLGTNNQGPPLLEIAQPVSATEPQTNQRAELIAIYQAVQIVQERNIWKEADKICFWTDSQYAIKCITEWGPGWQAKGWKKRDGKPIEHLDLLKPLIQLREEKGPKFTLRYVEAHQSAVRSQQFPWRYNARADALAQNVTTC